jgi:DNA-binding MarR family transcriptional regulator
MEATFDAGTAARSPQGCTHFKLRQLVRRVARLYDAELSQAGLKGTQYSLLSMLARVGPVQPAELARGLGLDASTLTRNLKPVVAAGWATQGPGRDERSRLIDITTAGRAKQSEARRHWKRAQSRVNAILGEVEVARLHAWIDSAAARLDAAD